ncbi:MAG: response regulator [Pirellulaceae bacterium]
MATSESPASILVVDDEFSVRESLYHWFRKEGYEVKAAENAVEALQALQDRRYDVAWRRERIKGF